MTNEQSQTARLLSYVDWRVQLRKDCETQGKLPAFDALGEYTLKLLWKNGLGPTVRDIVGSIDGQSELNTAQEDDGPPPQSAHTVEIGDRDSDSISYSDSICGRTDTPSPNAKE